MAKSRRAFAVGADVVDDRVLHVGADSGRHPVEPELVTHAPGHVVIRAGAVAADAQRARDAVAVIEREPASEHDRAAYRLAHHQILSRAEVVRRSGVQGFLGWWVAECRAEQEPARLRT